MYNLKNAVTFVPRSEYHSDHTIFVLNLAT